MFSPVTNLDRFATLQGDPSRERRVYAHRLAFAKVMEHLPDMLSGGGAGHKVRRPSRGQALCQIGVALALEQKRQILDELRA